MYCSNANICTAVKLFQYEPNSRLCKYYHCIVGYNKWLSMMHKYILIMIYQRALHWIPSKCTQWRPVLKFPGIYQMIWYDMILRGPQGELLHWGPFPSEGNLVFGGGGWYTGDFDRCVNIMTKFQIKTKLCLNCDFAASPFLFFLYKYNILILIIHFTITIHKPHNYTVYLWILSFPEDGYGW